MKYINVSRAFLVFFIVVSMYLSRENNDLRDQLKNTIPIGDAYKHFELSLSQIPPGTYVVKEIISSSPMTSNRDHNVIDIKEINIPYKKFRMFYNKSKDMQVYAVGDMLQKKLEEPNAIYTLEDK